MTYRYYHLMPDELSTLYIGFQRNLFTRPKEREILSIDSAEFQGGCTLFFEDNFLSKLISEYESAKVLVSNFLGSCQHGGVSLRRKFH